MSSQKQIAQKQIAIDAVLKAAKLCQKVQADMVPTDAIQKTDRSPVTVADFGSQALICKAISEALPEAVIVAEEDAASLKANPPLLERVVAYINHFDAAASAENVCAWIARGTGEVGDTFWTLDPIDGTKGFLRRDQYAIALAQVINGEVTLGVLACPNLPHRLNDTVARGPVPRDASNNKDTSDRDTLSARGCLFVAIRGEGTAMYSLTGTFLGQARVSADAHRMAESFESSHGDSDAHAKVANQLGITAPPVQMDSQAKYGILARGEAAVYLRLPNPASLDYRECIWDHAAGLIVVEEAGGTVTDANGAPLSFLTGRRMVDNRGIVATNGKLHQRVLDAIPRLAKT